jgi:putative FmdB family regulatory protein
MPLYEYVCQDCSHEFEMLVNGNETVECPGCHGRKVEQQLSLPGRPKVTSGASLPMGCNSSGPPCGPVCRRWPGNS